MGALEANEALARFGPKKGEVRNPDGKTDRIKYVRHKHIRAALLAELDQPCGVKGFEHLTKFQWGLQEIIERWMDGERWAVKYVTDRIWGPVPLNVDVEVAHRPPDLSSMTEDELLAQVEQLRQKLLAQRLLLTDRAAGQAADAELIPDEPDSRQQG
jgi:hypothetical protein